MKKYKIARERLMSMWDIANYLLSGNVTEMLPRKFGYALARNLDLLEAVRKASETATKKDADYQKYDEARVELAKKMAKRGEDDKPVVVNNRYVQQDQLAFDKALEGLQEEHREAYNRHQEFLAEELEIELYEMKLSTMPDNVQVIAMRVMNPIMVDDTEEVDSEAE